MRTVISQSRTNDRRVLRGIGVHREETFGWGRQDVVRTPCSKGGRHDRRPGTHVPAGRCS
jgi:hypothetical protein